MVVAQHLPQGRHQAGDHHLKFHDDWDNLSGGEEVFWAMHRALMHHQARLEDASLRSYAQQVGADPELATGAAAQQFAGIVQADYQAGIDLGVSATPSIFIDGEPYSGRVDLPSLRRATGL